MTTGAWTATALGDDLRGKRVLVTGSSRGIGAAVAAAFAGVGARVALHASANRESAEKLAATAARIPLGRLGTAEDCVGAYLFLASSRFSGYITGQIIEVNGGQLMA